MKTKKSKSTELQEEIDYINYDISDTAKLLALLVGSILAIISFAIYNAFNPI